jgi:S-adenosylmethionine:tRNA ribosyltransferase-isomerase
VTLHVGLDTFAPVTEDDPREHQIHTEWCELRPKRRSRSTRRARGRAGGGGWHHQRAHARIGCPGGGAGSARGSVVAPFSGPTDLYIAARVTFRVVDAMVTNFHLPRSTLIMLVSAFAGRERILDAYRQAVELEYRFFSFGDAMLIL